MKELINKVFEENNFNNIEINNPYSEEVNFFGNYSKNATNFYLVLFLDEIENDFLFEKVPRYFEEIKKMKTGYDERIDKNLSMIVCYKETKNDSFEKRNKLFFDIEEDPYYFKKYLLSYNDMEVNVVNKEFYQGNKLTDFINSVVINSKYFEEFKTEQDSDHSNLYKICSKMMIKIPVINLEYKKDELENLSYKINEMMEDEELNDLRKTILNTDFIDEEEVLENILKHVELEVEEDE